MDFAGDGSLPHAAGDTSAIVTAFEVKGIVDYDKLVRDFGSQRLDEEMVQRLERVTGKKAHHLISR